MTSLKNIKADEGTIKAQVLADANGEVIYIKDIAKHGCTGGLCGNLIYYTDTHAFTAKYMDEINEILSYIEDITGENILVHAKINGDIFNYLAWLAYEVTAQNIMREIDPNY